MEEAVEKLKNYVSDCTDAGVDLHWALVDWIRDPHSPEPQKRLEEYTKDRLFLIGRTATLKTMPEVLRWYDEQMKKNNAPQSNGLQRLNASEQRHLP